MLHQIAFHDGRASYRNRFVRTDGFLAERPGATAEDDGYLVTFTTDVGRDLSECLVFDAPDIADGPIARVRLPERISAGTHSCWVGTANR